MGKRRKNNLQLTFNILPIGERATRRAVEEYIETVRQYRQIGFMRRKAAVTQAYVYREHQSTNAISKQTETIAVYNVDREAQLISMDERLTIAMSSLSSIQQDVLERSYLDHEGEFDYIIAGEMHMSDRRLREIKQAALDTLATMIDLTVYRDVASSVI